MQKQCICKTGWQKSHPVPSISGNLEIVDNNTQPCGICNGTGWVDDKEEMDDKNNRDQNNNDPMFDIGLIH